MAIFIVIFAVICLWGIKIYPPKKFNSEYISKNNTNAVKGVFVFLVFMSHFAQYYDMSSTLDLPYKYLQKILGQLIVTVFLFYSGYGIAESIKKKGSSYVKSFPLHRCLKVLFHFDIAVLIYLIFSFIIGKKYAITKILFAFIGWESIGNSNWFIFTIIIQYFIVFLAFTLFPKKRTLAISAVTVISIIYMLAMSQVKADYWYNTALCLPLGLWYSAGKEKIEKIVFKNDFVYVGISILVLLCLAVEYKTRHNIVMYELYTICFTLLVVLITMKVNLGNKVLYWLGNHVFSVYILQRIPMTLFSKIEFISSNQYVYFLTSLAVTILIAELFDRGTGKLDKLIFKK